MPILVVAATDSPDPLRRSTARLAELLPTSESVHVPGGHLMNPADAAVLAFIGRHATSTDT